MALLALVEIVLLCVGEKPGRFNASFDPHDSLFPNRVTYTDSIGITRYDAPFDALGDSIPVNADGFRSTFDYSCETLDSLAQASPDRKLIMMIGDSYVAGCCIPDMGATFPDRIAAEDGYYLLNMGMPATNPQQYALVAREYFPQIRPSLAVVCVFLGNDLLLTDPPIACNTYPWFQHRRNRDWIPSLPPDYLTGGKDIILHTPQAAQEFYMNHATLHGENRNFWERCCGQTILCSKILLGMEYWRNKSLAQAKHANPERITYRYLHEIQALGEALHLQTLFIGLPSAVDVIDEIDLQQQYGKYFQDIPWVHPPRNLLAPDDYDGSSTVNHFTVSGHFKTYQWLSGVLASKLAMQDSAVSADRASD